MVLSIISTAAFRVRQVGLNPKNSFTLTLAFFFVSSAIVRAILLHSNQDNNLREITFARLDAIASGVSVAFLSALIKTKNIFRNISFALAGLILFVSVIVTVILGYDFVKGNIVMLVAVPLGFSLALPFLSLLEVPSGSFRLFSVIVGKVSLWSYSIYLSHIPIMWITYYIMEQYRNTFYGNLFSKVVSLFFTIAISGFLYTFFELSFTRKRPRQSI